MKKCVQCQQELYDNVAVCPYCRTPQPAKKKNTKALLLIPLIIVLVIAALAAGVFFYFKSCQNKAEEQIEQLFAHNQTVYFLEEDYVDDAAGKEEYILHEMNFTDRDTITEHEYELFYTDNSPEYALFYADETEWNYYIKTDLFGRVFLTSGEETIVDITIETDEDYKITALSDETGYYLPVADFRYVNDWQNYLSHKAQYDNLDTVVPTFLSMGYYGYSTTWREVLDHTFVSYTIDVALSDKYDNGYQLTISGEYSINPVYLPEVTNEGEMVLAFNNDLTKGTFISGEEVKRACDLYVSLGTTWYLDQFGNY